MFFLTTLEEWALSKKVNNETPKYMLNKLIAYSSIIEVKEIEPAIN